MRPTQHLSNNDVLRAPDGASSEECRPLAITRIVFNNAGPAVCSYWQPSAEELRLLSAGQAVRLSCMGMTHPPVYIGVDGDGLI